MLQQGKIMPHFFLAFVLLFSSTLSFAKENKMSDAFTKVQLTTSLGVITLQLNEEKAPISTANFLTYVTEGFYNATIFHRIIPGFMIQGGGFNTAFEQKTTNKPIKNEADNGLSNKRGTLAMARTQVPDSATGQFFINLVDNRSLDFTSATASGWGYAVFGEVLEGMDIVDTIAKQATGSRQGHGDVPKVDIILEKAEIID
jgi:peptidyl-prolyl cis-trans isomerase B (cyclophilin B)